MISVIMPVYNGGVFLIQAVNSILNQTFHDFELIIINDCSTDGTQQVIEHLKLKDNRILLINNKARSGPSKSANLGIAIAKGTYIARMDADDISHPLRFEKQISYLNDHHDIGILGTNGYYIDEKNNKIKSLNHYSGDLEIRWGLLFNSQFLHSSIILKKSLLSLVGGYREDLFYAEDYDLFSRLLKYAKYANLRERLVYWRKSSSNVTSLKKGEILNFGSLISKRNINNLFGNDFIVDEKETLNYRKLYKGTFVNINNNQLARYLEIINTFIIKNGVGFYDEKRIKIEIASKMFESIYRKGLKKSNFKYLKIIAKISPFAIPNGIKNLGMRALNRLLGWLKYRMNNEIDD